MPRFEDLEVRRHRVAANAENRSPLREIPVWPRCQPQQAAEGIWSADAKAIAGVSQDDRLHQIHEQGFRRIPEPHVGITAVDEVPLQPFLEGASPGRLSSPSECT
jgi:hypothetical protein